MSSLVRFLKDWTLPVAMLLGASLYLLFAFVPCLDGASRLLAPVAQGLLPVFMFLVLFVTFCKVDFHKMQPVWWHLFILVAHLLFVGAVMALTLSATQSPDDQVVMESVLMCVIAPCAAAAPVVTQKLGGSLEQMTTYTFLSNFLTAFLVPVCFPLIENRSDVTFLSAFSTILYQVATVLVVPMLLAYVVKHRLHRLHQLITSVRDLSFYLWGCSLTIVTGATVKNIVHAQATVRLLCLIALLALLLCVIQFAVGRLVGRHFRHAQEAGQALGQKNTAFAIWLSMSFLTPLSSVGPGCYILWQNIVNSIEIWHHNRRVKTRPVKSPCSHLSGGGGSARAASGC